MIRDPTMGAVHVVRGPNAPGAPGAGAPTRRHTLTTHSVPERPRHRQDTDCVIDTSFNLLRVYCESLKIHSIEPARRCHDLYMSAS